MLDSLFGMEVPTVVKAVIAFAIVLALLAIVAWLFRRFGGARVGSQPARGRQPRLAVIDAAAVDSRRRLVLIRRDNVEHLVMIGGPTDVLIEQNIVRAVPVAPPREGMRELGTRDPARDPMQRDPMQRDPTQRDPMSREPMPRDPREGMPREPSPRDAGRAPDDLGLRGSIDPQRPSADFSPRGGRGEPRQARSDVPRRTAEFDRRREPAPSPRPAPPGFQRPGLDVEPPDPGPLGPSGPSGDPKLSAMANKLEAALRRPNARQEPEFGTPPTLTEPPPPTAPDLHPAGNGFGPASGAPSASSAPRGEAPPVKSPKADAPKPAGGKSVFDSLEEEMQSLLGKPPETPENK